MKVAQEACSGLPETVMAYAVQPSWLNEQLCTEQSETLATGVDIGFSSISAYKVMLTL